MPGKRGLGNFDLANLWADPKSSDSSCKKGLRLATDLRHHAAGLSTARYRVDRAMPKRAAISATGTSAVLSRARMVLISLGESFAGRPPLRPRARADLRPATVLSRIKLRSNSARAAKTWNTRRPVGERVSIFSVSDSKLILRCSSSAISLTRSAKFLPSRPSLQTTRVSLTVAFDFKWRRVSELFGVVFRD